jgi:hypothetical protein
VEDREQRELIIARRGFTGTAVLKEHRRGLLDSKSLLAFFCPRPQWVAYIHNGWRGLNI